MRYILLAVTLILTVSVSVAQPDQCAAILQKELEKTNENCAGLGPGFICYGAGIVKASAVDGSDSSPVLGVPSDMIPIGGVGQIVTTPIDLESGGIGVAVMSLAVRSPETDEEQMIALVLVGDATLEILSPPENSEADSTIPAFLLKGGSTNPECPGSPNGLIVQTPQQSPYTLNINGANVTMSSTVYFTVSPEQEMVVAALEGQAAVGPVEGERTRVVTGFTSRINLDSDTEQITGEWSDAGLFDDFYGEQFAAFEMLDSSFLNYEIDAPDEDYLDEIKELLESDDFDYDDFVDQFEDSEDEFDDDSEVDDAGEEDNDDVGENEVIEEDDIEEDAEDTEDDSEDEED
ncbi:MAG: hypothetical protein L0154_07875 [Chloroflexi bacterium]|nr:hypothetical protein [Chloroflexota bacterium]